MSAQLSKVQGVGADFACLGHHYSSCIISLLHPGGFFDANLKDSLYHSWYDSWKPRFGERKKQNVAPPKSSIHYPIYLRASLIDQRVCMS